MSGLHQRTQKLLCRTAFFLLCAAPTCVTLSWIAWRFLPWCELQWEKSLATALELDVDLEGAREPRPGVLQAKRLTLSTLRREQTLVDLYDLEATAVGAKRVVVARRVVVHLAANAAPTIAHACRQAAMRLVRCQDKGELHVDALELAIPDEKRDGNEPTSIRVTQFKGRWTPGGSSSPHALQLMAHPADNTQSAPWSLVWTRSGQEAPVEHLQLDVSQGGFPLSLFAYAAGEWKNLAPAQLAGVVHVERTVLDARGSLQGTVRDLPLQKILGRPTLASATGSAEARLDSLTWRGSRIERARGELRIASGAMSRSLWDAAIERLGCEAPANSESTVADDSVPFDLAACRFHMDKSGLAIEGACPTSSSAAGDGRALLMRGGSPLLLEPRAPLHLGAWIHFLSPSAAPPGWMPATREAVATASRLPLH